MCKLQFQKGETAQSLCITTRLQVTERYLAVLTLLALHVDTEHVRPVLDSQCVLWTNGLTTLSSLILLQKLTTS